jgi:hypothetical protein
VVPDVESSSTGADDEGLLSSLTFEADNTARMFENESIGDID